MPAPADDPPPRGAAIPLSTLTHQALAAAPGAAETRSAWLRFLPRARPRLVPYIRNRCACITAEDADDIFQEVMAEFALKGGPRATLGADDEARARRQQAVDIWLYQSAKWHAIDFCRRVLADRRGGGAAMVPIDEPAGEASLAPAETLPDQRISSDAAEATVLVARIIDCMGSHDAWKTRVAFFTCRGMQEMSSAEIAAQFGTTEANVHAGTCDVRTALLRALQFFHDAPPSSPDDSDGASRALRRATRRAMLIHEIPARLRQTRPEWVPRMKLYRAVILEGRTPDAAAALPPESLNAETEAVEHLICAALDILEAQQGLSFGDAIRLALSQTASQSSTRTP